MKEIVQFNQEANIGSQDKIQYTFKLKKMSEKQTKAEFKKEVLNVLNHFYLNMAHSKPIKASALSRLDFDGIKKFTEEMIGQYQVTYSAETILGFPYSVGVLTYTIGGMKYYKFGITIFKTQP